MDVPRTLAQNPFQPFYGKYWPIQTDQGPHLVNRRGEAITGDQAIAEVRAELHYQQRPPKEITDGIQRMYAEAEDTPALYDRIDVDQDDIISLYLGGGRHAEIADGEMTIEDWADYTDDKTGVWTHVPDMQYRAIPKPATTIPTPDLSGHRDELRDILGFEPDAPAWLQIYGWLVGSTFPHHDRPILWLVGPQGSGKSTLGRILASVLNPTRALGGPLRDPRSDMARFIAQRCPTFDNVSEISQAQSDQLCRLVTGETYERRALFTNDELITDVIKRTAIATSITLPTGLKADALQRCLVVELAPVTPNQRRLQGDIDTAFKKAHARILGALINDITGACANRYEQPEELPRLADYGLTLHGLGLHTGDDYLGAYNAAVGDALADRAKESNLTRRLAENINSTWTGTIADLATLVGFRGTPESLGAQLRKETETLRSVGITVDSKRTMHARVLTIRVP